MYQGPTQPPEMGAEEQGGSSKTRCLRARKLRAKQKLGNGESVPGKGVSCRRAPTSVRRRERAVQSGGEEVKTPAGA